MRKLLVALAAGLSFAAMSAGSAGAQTVDGSLKGVKKFELLIEKLDEDSATCGITESGLTKAAKKAVKRAPFKLGGEEYSLYIRTTTLPLDGKCFSSVIIQAYFYGQIVLPSYPKGNYAEVTLWENSTISITEERTHGRRINGLVTEMIESLASDWKKDNS